MSTALSWRSAAAPARRADPLLARANTTPGPLTRAACRLDRLWDLRFAVLSGHTLSVYRRSDLGADGRGAEAGLNEVRCRASGRAAASGVA